MHRMLLLVAAGTVFAALSNGQVEKETELKLLRDDVAELKKLVVDLTKTVQASCSCQTVQHPDANKTRQNVTEHKPYRPFKILALNSTHHFGYDPRYDYVNYSVNYIANHSDSLTDFSYWNRQNNDYSYTKMQGVYDSKMWGWPRPSLDANTSVFAIPENQTSVLFVFGDAKVYYVIRLNNSVGRDVTLKDVSLPDVDVVPSEIVYTRGENFTIQLNYSDNIELPDDVSVDSIINVIGTDTFSERSYTRSVVNLERNKTVWNSANITMNVSETMLSGVITFRAIAKNDNPLIESIEVYRQVVLRPINQSGPFSDGLFTFFNKYMNADLNGTIIQGCSSDSPCDVRCPMAVGSNKTRMSVWYWGGNGKNERIQVSSEVVQNPLYISEYAASIPKNVDAAYCSATDMKSSKTISQEIKIKRPTPLNVTNVQVAIKSRNGNEVTVRVSCEAQGTPEPRMEIQIMSLLSGVMQYFDSLLTSSETGDSKRVYKDLVLNTFQYPDLLVACVASSVQGVASKEAPSISLRKET